MAFGACVYFSRSGLASRLAWRDSYIAGLFSSGGFLTGAAFLFNLKRSKRFVGLRSILPRSWQNAEFGQPVN